MGMLDNLKDKAKEAAREHGDKIAGGLDKARDMAKAKTGGQHDDKIDKGVERAKQAVEDLNSKPAVEDLNRKPAVEDLNR